MCVCIVLCGVVWLACLCVCVYVCDVCVCVWCFMLFNVIVRFVSDVSCDVVRCVCSCLCVHVFCCLIRLCALCLMPCVVLYAVCVLRVFVYVFGKKCVCVLCL